MPRVELTVKDSIGIQPDGGTRDQGEASMANIASLHSDWDDALSWAGAIESETMRKSTLDNVFQRGWNRREKTLNPELLQAAEAAGFGEQARAYGR